MKSALYVFIFTAAFFMFAGCVTLPGPIDEVYLKEVTPEESAKLTRIEAEVVAKNKEKGAMEKSYEVALERIEVTRKEIAVIDASGLLLVEKEKLYTLSGENQKLAELQKQREQNRVKGTQAKTYLDYNNAKKEEISARIEVKKAELAVLVAELDYEKAVIAKAYQTKRSKEFKNKMIDDEEYKKFLLNQKNNLEDNKKKYEKAAKALAEAEEKFRKSGYEEEK